MQIQKFTIIALLLWGFLFNHCYTRIGDFTVISTRNSNIKNWKRGNERVEGYSCSWWLFFIPLKKWNVKDAVEDAVDTYNKNSQSKGFMAESLLDMKFSLGLFYFIIVNRECIYAEGVPADSWYSTQEREDQIKKN